MHKTGRATKRALGLQELATQGVASAATPLTSLGPPTANEALGEVVKRGRLNFLRQRKATDRRKSSTFTCRG